jgi:uncharacterized protein YjbI with pentapeptide repeats
MAHNRPVMVRRVGLVALAALGLLLLWEVPRWQAAPSRAQLSAQELLLLENQLRLTLVLALGAALTVGTLVVLARRMISTERRGRAALELARAAQHAERCARAVAQLDDARLDVRVAALYGLEQIARESPAQHWPIMEVLCAFVRDRTPWDPGRPVAARLPTDIQAALTVVGRRTHSPAREERLDLRRTDLRGADLNEAHFERAVLRGAHLAGASLQSAHLTGADLRGADLRNADLVAASLERADLREAHLESAYLVEAHLEGADLGGACLSGAYLGGAHLEGADLGGADLGGAYLYHAHLDGASLHRARAVTAVGSARPRRDGSSGGSLADDLTAARLRRFRKALPVSLRRRRRKRSKRAQRAPA